MREQTYPPKRPNMAHFEIPDEKKTSEQGKAQLDQLLDDYRKRYVLRPPRDDKPAP